MPKEEDNSTKPTPVKKQPPTANEVTKDMSKPPAGYPGLAGDLSQDPIGESLRDRLNFGGLGINVDEVTIKKHGCKVPK